MKTNLLYDVLEAVVSSSVGARDATISVMENTKFMDQIVYAIVRLAIYLVCYSM